METMSVWHLELCELCVLWFLIDQLQWRMSKILKRGRWRLRSEAVSDDVWYVASYWGSVVCVCVCVLLREESLKWKSERLKCDHLCCDCLCADGEKESGVEQWVTEANQWQCIHMGFLWLCSCVSANVIWYAVFVWDPCMFSYHCLKGFIFEPFKSLQPLDTSICPLVAIMKF